MTSTTPSADLTGLLDHLGEESAVFIGLDFGVFAIYDLAFRAPQRVRAIIGLENPATPHNPQLPPLVEARQWALNHFVHIHYFEPCGPADAALAAQPREFLTGVFYALSGDYHYLDVWKHPPGTSYLDALPQPPPLPWKWLSELEMEFFVSEYARTGFTGGLNWYRAMDLRWAQRRRFEGRRTPRRSSSSAASVTATWRPGTAMTRSGSCGSSTRTCVAWRCSPRPAT